MRTSKLGWLAAAAIVFAACGDDGDAELADGGAKDAGVPDGATDADARDGGPGDGGRDGATRDAGRDVDAGRDAGAGDTGVDSSMADAGPESDGNDSFEQADPVVVGDADGTSDVIDPAGDHDFFSFTGSAGDWVAVVTDSNADGDDAVVDTVLRLYDSTMTQIAENDDAVGGVGTDSEIIIRLPGDGIYYVEVLEWSEWADGETPHGDPGYDYSVVIDTLDGADASTTEELEAGDDAASAQALPFSTDYQLLVGAFGDDTDVDVYSLSVAAGETKILQATPMPAGPSGYGSTTPAGAIWVTDASAATIIARIDQSAGYEGLAPSLEPGDYLLWITHPGGGAGDNDFYVGKISRSPETPREAATDDGTLATAEALTLTEVPGEMRRSGFILAHLDDADVDYFSFDVSSGETVTVSCSSASGGSGVQGLTVEVRDEADAALGATTETPPEPALLRDVAADPGTAYLRLSKMGQDSEVTGDWVRCGVHAFATS